MRNIISKIGSKIVNSAIFTKVTLWMFAKAFNSGRRKELEPHLIENYRRVVRESFVIKTEIVKVKKGTRRYDLAFIEDRDMKRKVTISRHLNHPAREIQSMEVAL